MNENLALLITEAKAARKTYEKSYRKYGPSRSHMYEADFHRMKTAESALALWVIKNVDKLRSVE
jgi:hypothetical protein